MSKAKRLRRISLIMLVIAVIFVLCALSNPQLGHAIYIGNFRFGADQWRVCYVIYVVVMVVMFIISCVLKHNYKSEKGGQNGK